MDELVSPAMPRCRENPTALRRRATLRTPGDIRGEESGGPLLTSDPPVRDG